jgi:hypothetical protein
MFPFVAIPTKAFELTPPKLELIAVVGLDVMHDFGRPHQLLDQAALT